MCGITAHLTTDKQPDTQPNSNQSNSTPQSESETVFDKLLSDLLILQNRGYDSAGISTISNLHITTSKIAGSEKVTALSLLKEFRSKHLNGNPTIGIGHMRWATHGQKSSFNSHPHSDEKDRLSLVHNGIIHNYFQMKSRLLESNPTLTFKSETDSEVVAIQLGLHLDSGQTFQQAFKTLQSEMSGTWAIVAISVLDPNTLFVCKNKNPLLVSIDSENLRIQVSSEITTLKTSAYALHDGTCLSLTIKSNKIVVVNCLTGEVVTDLAKFGDLEMVSSKPRKTSPYPYAHWTLSEIHEQPTSIESALHNRICTSNTDIFQELTKFGPKLKQVEHLLIFGCGSSFFSGLYATNWLRSFSVFCTVQVFDAAAFTYDCLPQRVDSSLIAAIVISQSGETMDILKCLELIKLKSIFTIGLINVTQSTVARKVDCLLELKVEREEAVASTKSFTAQATIMLALGLWFKSQRNGEIDSSYWTGLKSFSSDVRECLKLSETCKKLAFQIVGQGDRSACGEEIGLSPGSCVSAGVSVGLSAGLSVGSKTNTNTPKSMFLLGRGFAEPIAYEGALKIKEIAYIHAEGYLSPALKHGSYAILEPGTICILFIFNDAYKEYMISTAKELESRHAKCICVTTETDLEELNLFTSVLKIPSNEHFSSLLGLIPIQLLAYELGLAKHNSIDMCRNLAKTVTVD